MPKPFQTLRQLIDSTVSPPLLVLRDFGAQLSNIIPDVSDRVRFRHFWGNGGSLRKVYFVMDSYEGVALRNRFRFEEASWGRGALDTLAGNTVIDGAFAPQAAAMLADLFARYAPNVLRVVTDSDPSPAPESTLVSYGTSDSNCKTFDIEASSGGNLCRFLRDENGRRSFRLAEQTFSVESRGGVLYDKAIVLRLTNREDTAHCHVVCAGLSEWGSLAAVRYLTMNWRELHKRFDRFGHRRDFCVLLEVPYGRFQNAREVISAVSWEPECVPDPVLVSSHV